MQSDIKMIFCHQWQTYFSTVRMLTPHTVVFIRDYLQNLGVKRMESSATSIDLSSTEHLSDQFVCAVRARVTNKLALFRADSKQNAGRRMRYHPTAVCDQAGDQHEEEVPGCCGFVWFFRTILRLLFDNSPNKNLFGTGREDVADLSWVQPRYSVLLLIPQMHVPY